MSALISDWHGFFIISMSRFASAGGADCGWLLDPRAADSVRSWVASLTALRASPARRSRAARELRRVMAEHGVAVAGPAGEGGGTCGATHAESADPNERALA